MQLYSLTFLYLFLPVSLALFLITPAKWRSAVLFLISIAFYGLSQPDQFLIFCGMLVLQYALSEGLRRTEGSPRLHKAIYVFGIMENAGAMILFSALNQITGRAIPLGTMVVAFTSLGYLVDVYKYDAEYETNFFRFGLFLGFFAKLYRGPLVRIDNLWKKPIPPKPTLEQIGNGLVKFIRGLAKYVLLSVPIGQVCADLKAADELTVVGAWMVMITFAMKIFFDLSGFCDMARGLGLCFGLELPKNFWFPFQSASVTEFFSRFNMTVTEFFHYYVYDNLKSEKPTPLQDALNTSLVCMLAGVWFGIRMNFIVWGLYIAAFILLEKWFLGRYLERIPRFFSGIYTFCVTMLSMVIFSADSLGEMLRYFGAMFGFSAIFSTAETAYDISGSVIPLIAGAVLLTNFMSVLIHKLRRRSPSVGGAYDLVMSTVLLALCTAYLL